MLWYCGFDCLFLTRMIVIAFVKGLLSSMLCIGLARLILFTSLIFLMRRVRQGAMKPNVAELIRGRVRIQIQLSAPRVDSSLFYQLSSLHSTAQRICSSAKARLEKTWGILLVFSIFPGNQCWLVTIGVPLKSPIWWKRHIKRARQAMLLFI